MPSNFPPSRPPLPLSLYRPFSVGDWKLTLPLVPIPPPLPPVRPKHPDCGPNPHQLRLPGIRATQRPRDRGADVARGAPNAADGRAEREREGVD